MKLVLWVFVCIICNKKYYKNGIIFWYFLGKYILIILCEYVCLLSRNFCSCVVDKYGLDWMKIVCYIISVS